MNDTRHWRNLQVIEIVLIAVMAITEWLWASWSGMMDHWMTMSFCALAGTLALSFVNFPGRSQKMIIIVLLLQTALAATAAALGTPRLYALLFLLFAAKSALMLDKKVMIVLVTVMAGAHTAATMFVGYAFTHLHGHMQPLGAASTHILRVEAQVIFLVGIVLVSMLGRKVLAEERAKRSAEHLSQELQELAVTLERMRIARDIHDGLGHTLTSLNIQLELTSRLLQDRELDKAEQSLSASRAIAKDCLNETRAAVQAVRAEGDFSLKQAVERMVARISEQQKVDFDLAIDDQGVSGPARDQLFCIMQECLTNIQKHSHADKVKIVLKQTDGRCELSVEDNGVGFERQNKDNGFGLVGMKERVESLGGSLKVESSPGKGTLVQLTVPV
ncbi:MAG TPA: sensor histidine kinase [Candidatus Obscuribacterales bacterium]